MSASKRETGFFFSLTDGALNEVAFERSDGEGRAWGIGADGRASWLAGQYTVGKDLFLTVEEAKEAAEAARAKKLASLRKQVAKLEAMVFGASSS